MTKADSSSFVAPTDSQLAQLLRLATRAPSAGNMQPWRFRREGAALLVTAFGGSEMSALNHDGRASALTLGGLLEYLTIAATTLGLDAEADLVTEATPDARWAAVRFRPREAPADPLALALELRCTDRRDYRGGELTDPVFAEITDECREYPQCRLYLRGRDAYTPELLRYVADAERFFWTCEPVHSQVMKVVRWSEGEAAARRDGVRWEALGLGRSAARVLRVWGSFTAQRLLNRLGFLAAVDRLTESALRSAAGVGLVTVGDTSRAAFVAAARLHTRIWLRLQRAGHALQPFTAASLYASDAESGQLPREWPESQQRLFAPGMAVLRRAFGFGAGEIPVWLFRAGRSPGPLARDLCTHRYEVARVLAGEVAPVNA